MLTRLLSNDLPRSRAAGGAARCAACSALAFAPFIFPGVKALSVAAKVLVFIVLVASFDLLLGYTGIVSFAHTMFFGIGAYGIAIVGHAARAQGWGAVLRRARRGARGVAACCRWRSACSRCGCARSSSR